MQILSASPTPRVLVSTRTSSEYNAAVCSFFRLSLFPGLFDTSKEYCRDGQEQMLFLQGRPGTNVISARTARNKYYALLPPPPPPPWSTTSLSVCLLCELIKSGFQFQIENKTSLHLFCNITGGGGGGGGGGEMGRECGEAKVFGGAKWHQSKTPPDLKQKWFLWTMWVIASPGLGCDFFSFSLLS